MIYFCSHQHGLWRVPASGGQRELLAKPEYSKGELHFQWPELLPGGKAILLTVATGTQLSDALIAVFDLATRRRADLVEGTNPHYAMPGFLVFCRGGSLWAASFDPTALAVQGAPRPVLDGVAENIISAHFFVSLSGSLAFVRGPLTAPTRTLVVADRRGSVRPLTREARLWVDPYLSPGGRWLAVSVQGPNQDLWLLDTTRETLTRLTSEPGSDMSPVLTRDGKRVIFTSNRGGAPNLFWKSIDPVGPDEPLARSEYIQFPTSVSPSGDVLLYWEIRPGTGYDIWTLSLDGKREARPLVQGPFREAQARFSPDGKWIAYTSNESGRDEVYVVSYPSVGKRFPISTGGGSQPVWGLDGRELFYRDGNRMMSVPIRTSGEFEPDKPRLLFELPFEVGGANTNYDINHKGDFILIQATRVQPPPNRIEVVLHWSQELAAQLAAGK